MSSGFRFSSCARLSASSWRVRSRPRSRGLDHDAQIGARLVVLDRLLGQRRARQDHHEQIVEVVRDAAREHAQALELLHLEQPALQRLLLVLRAGALLEEADAPGRHRDLARPSRSGSRAGRRVGRRHPSSPKVPHPKTPNGLSSRRSGTLTIVRLPSCATISLLVRGSTRASSTTTGTSEAQDLLHHAVALDLEHRRHRPDQLLVGAGVVDEPDLVGVLAIGDEEPDALVADRGAHLGAGRRRAARRRWPRAAARARRPANAAAARPALQCHRRAFDAALDRRRGLRECERRTRP